MATKITCKSCDQTKPLDEFYVSNLRTCKECVRQRVRRNRASNLAYYRDYDAKRFQDDPKVRARHKRYQSTAAGKAAVRRSTINFQERNPEKRRAHNLLNDAVRDGRAHKPDCCQDCGKVPEKRRDLQGHHDDYSKPLDVIWLCIPCHRARHGNFKRQERA